VGTLKAELNISAEQDADALLSERRQRSFAQRDAKLVESARGYRSG
jgi:hypothetical protein